VVFFKLKTENTATRGWQRKLETLRNEGDQLDARYLGDDCFLHVVRLSAKKNVLGEPQEMERAQLGLTRGCKSEHGVDP